MWRGKLLTEVPVLGQAAGGKEVLHGRKGPAPTQQRVVQKAADSGDNAGKRSAGGKEVLHERKGPAPTQQRVVQKAADGGTVLVQLLQSSVHAVKAGGLPHKLDAEPHCAVVRHVLRAQARHRAECMRRTPRQCAYTWHRTA